MKLLTIKPTGETATAKYLTDANGNLFVAADTVTYNPLSLVVIARDTRNITPSFIFDDDDVMVVDTPTSGRLEGTSFNFPVTYGDYIIFTPKSENWDNMTYISLINDVVDFNLEVNHTKFVNCTNITISPASLSGDWDNMSFPNTKYFYVELNTTVTGNKEITYDKLPSGLTTFYNVGNASYSMIIDDYPEFRNMRGVILYGDLSKLYRDGSWSSFLGGINSSCTGYFDDFLVDLNDSGFGIGRLSVYAASNLVHLPSVYIPNILQTLGGSYTSITGVAFDVASFSGTTNTHLNFICNTSVGTLPYIDTWDRYYGLRINNSVVFGDASACRKQGAGSLYEINIVNTGMYTYTKDTSNPRVGFAPRIFKWYNCISGKTTVGSETTSDISEQHLVDLISDVTYFAIENELSEEYLTGGSYSLGGANPSITDQTALYEIEKLTTARDTIIVNPSSPYDGEYGLGWTVIHN